MLLFWHAVEIINITLGAKIFFSNLQFIAATLIPPSFLAFALHYSNREEWLRRRLWVLLALEPLTTLILVFTDPSHGLIRQNPRLVIQGSYVLLTFSPGSWYWVHMLYVYAVVLTGSFLIIRYAIRPPQIYRGQALALLVGVFAPLLSGALFILKVSAPGIDISMAGYIVSGLAFAWAIFHYQLLDIMPIARNKLVERMGDGWIVLDKLDRVVDMNPAAQEVVGYTVNQAVGRPIAQFPAPWPRLVENFRDKRDAQAELGLDKDGEPIHYDLRVSPLTGRHGRRTGRLMILRDITERKRAESQRDATLEALQELNATLEAQVLARTADIRAEQQKSEVILSNVGDAIMLTDLKKRIQFVNAAFTAHTGYTSQEVLGLNAETISGGTRSMQIWQTAEATLAQGKTWQGEASSRRKDGRTYDASLTIAPVRDADGQLVGYVSSHRDISQRKELERARSQFMTNVSHALRMPLTNIKLYTQMLQSGRRPEKADHYLRVLAEQVGVLEHLVQDSLEMTLLDSGRSVTTWEPLRLPEMIQDAVTHFQGQALAADLILNAGPIPDKLPVVQGDQTRLNRALAEVVENAIIFTSMRNRDETPTLAKDRESRRVSIETGTIDDGEQIWVAIVVRDTGPGILPKEQERVFDRFFRGNLAESGHIAGAGLGLSIAQAIVQAHGGRVTMESEPGLGSTFTLWLRGSPDQQDLAQRVG